MGLRNLNLKKAYDSDSDEILDEFYIPVLSQAISYKRLVGFFSSSSLAVAARGISDFIRRGGYMKLITSAKLQKADIEAIKEAYEEPERVIESVIINDLEHLDNEFIKDHVRALGWMIANKRLNIKVAIVYGEEGFPLDEREIGTRGIFHPKIGILEDGDGDKISFSGSDNESATAWLENIEEFKVFRSWEESEREYLNSDINRFEKFWNGKTKRTRIIDIPTAVREKLIEIAPNNIEELNLEKWLRKRRIETKRKIILRDYQNQAIENWFKHNRKGIFEMATGTGKTFTALGCLKKLMEDEKRLVTVIACPYSHLVKQWEDNIKDFDISSDSIIADSSNPNWKDELMDKVYDIKNEISDRLIILTTHVTLSINDFIKIIKNVNCNLFLIVDEVHGIGAPERKKALIENYHMRLGLSATPRRWLDEEGTEDIFKYFGDTIFEFSLKKAINTLNPDTGKTYLVSYEYKPYFIELTDEELQKYEEETEKIARSYFKTNNKKEKNKLFTLLCIKRQKIIENAVNKYTAFKKILDEISEIRDCLVYCSPQQIDTVQEILNERDVIQCRFTNREGTTSREGYDGISERQFILKKFAEGTYKALVAMKCLDEGVDVPPVKIAIILASTGNPRQYIQRRGRVLRHFLGKEKAIIYDIIVVPSLTSSINHQLLELERKILEKELKRYCEFADSALNTLECLNKIYNIEEKYHIVCS